jgi:Co/Zn/Cd efflux system component
VARDLIALFVIAVVAYEFAGQRKASSGGMTAGLRKFPLLHWVITIAGMAIAVVCLFILFRDLTAWVIR